MSPEPVLSPVASEVERLERLALTVPLTIAQFQWLVKIRLARLEHPQG